MVGLWAEPIGAEDTGEKPIVLDEVLPIGPARSGGRHAFKRADCMFVQYNKYTFGY
jgi:hypothetical protein